MATEKEMQEFYASSQAYLNQLKKHSLKEYSKYLKKIIENIKPKKKILDIGSGTGQISNFLQSKSFKVTGIDISPLFIKESKNQARKNNLETRFLVMNSCKLKFPNESFDAVISAETLEHILHPERMLKEIFRVLKKSGILVLRFPNKQSPLVNFAIRLNKKTRFEIVKPNLSSQVKGDDQDLCHRAATSDVLIFLKRSGFKILHSKPIFWPSALIVAKKT